MRIELETNKSLKTSVGKQQARLRLVIVVIIRVHFMPIAKANATGIVIDLKFLIKGKNQKK